MYVLFFMCLIYFSRTLYTTQYKTFVLARAVLGTETDPQSSLAKFLSGSYGQVYATGNHLDQPLFCDQCSRKRGH